MFRVLNTVWSKIQAQVSVADFAGKITNISIIESIIEDLRLVHLDEDALTQCVTKLSIQLSLAFHVIHENDIENPPALLPQAINA